MFPKAALSRRASSRNKRYIAVMVLYNIVLCGGVMSVGRYDRPVEQSMTVSEQSNVLSLMHMQVWCTCALLPILLILLANKVVG